MARTRIESSVTAISWIPSDAIEGLTKEPFELGLFHYDDPPPDVLGDLERLRAADAFRIANELRAWIELEDGRIVGYGHAGKAPIRPSTRHRCASSRRQVAGRPCPRRGAWPASPSFRSSPRPPGRPWR